MSWSTATPRHGAKTGISTAAVQLSSNATRNSVGVFIKALSGNSGTVYVGITGVTSANGYPLEAGEEVFLGATLLSELYVIGSEAGQEVRWLSQ